MTVKKILFCLTLILLTAILDLPQNVHSQGETAYDVINAVNQLRAQTGLEPYTIDPWLMTYAQDHADYLAEIQTGTHVHWDGTMSWDYGIHENVASGDQGYVTAAVAVFEVWVDWGHRHIMTDYASGEIGAGIAYDAVNNQMYYTLNIRPVAGVATLASVQNTSASFIPYLTSTPDEIGWLFHVVASGDTLWSIAVSYGVTVDEIRRLNPNLGDSNTIYIGQKLLVGSASTLQAVTATVSPLPITGTPRPTNTQVTKPTLSAQTLTAFPSPTGSPVLTATENPQSKTSIGLIVLIVISLIGVSLIAWKGFQRSQR